ncbi:hypothetical protein LMG28727_05629 [Paraburkholderia kirstenboschensis]|uniref:hypothetical protein n=1 Tax=Paraburkholderia kirstenboschensis TaxID=1245436 RepID=UPI000A5269BE|nr:hypothetical protein [Paraburkholderia kirstenboschensis]CAD6554019.1 hypothetical protein LMG28727_05629 [Paraburkholderia kirstenboschensis]
MSYWRKLFLVVLLALSLPVQSFAAVSMTCAPWEAVDDEATAEQFHQAELADAHAVVAASDDHQNHDHNGGHHVHACLTCASCCVGAALPVTRAVSASADQTQFSAPLPPNAGVVLFLTSGIERPPRPILV